MKNEFVPYDIALALKELGFNEPCIFYYAPDAITISKPTTGVCSSDRYGIIASPLYQQAFKWFREKYNLCGYVRIGDKAFHKHLKDNGFVVKDYRWNIVEQVGVHGMEDTHEEAQDACLRKLIEIVKEKID